MATTQTDALDLVTRAIAAGVDIDAAITATGQRVPSAGRHPFRADVAPERIARWLAETRVDLVAMFNRRQRDDLEAAVVAAEQAATAKPAEQTAEPLATAKQVQYIHELRARRYRNGEGDGFIAYDGDPAKLTRRAASSLIDSLRGEY